MNMYTGIDNNDIVIAKYYAYVHETIDNVSQPPPHVDCHRQLARKRSRSIYVHRVFASNYQWPPGDRIYRAL